MKPAVAFLLFLVALTIVAIATVDARKCRKSDSLQNDKRCAKSKKADRHVKTRLGRSKGRKKERKEAAPYWRRGPPRKDKTAREGKSLTLSCSIKGTPSPEFTWLRNGKTLTPDTHRKIHIRRHRLTIRRIAIEDTGTYTCVANNSLGSLDLTFSLKVLENIRFKSIEVVDRPENQTTHVGDTAIFLCRSQDFPQPSVHWTRQTSHSRIIESIATSNKSDDSVLVLHNVTKTDAGLYTCFIGTNRKYKQLSATLTVIDKGERLPFEPPCSLHIRREMLVDHETGCRSTGPVEMHYCMGSCGRSYYVPHMYIENSKKKNHLNQTCSCCVGVLERLRIVELECSLGQRKTGFYPLLRECQCQSCEVKGPDDPSGHQPTTVPPS